MTTTITAFGIDPVIPSAAPSPPIANTLYKENICRGWVNWDGSTVPGDTVRDSFNVDGITDHAVGDYTITWTTDFATTDYSISATSRVNAGANQTFDTGLHPSGNPTAGAIRIAIHWNSIGNIDRNQIHVIAFGAQ